MTLELSDVEIRAHAIRLHPDYGEDAYHDAVCAVLSRGELETIENPVAFFWIATKRALYKIFRHERAEMEQTLAWLRGDPAPTAQGLENGRLTHTHCRRGHPLIEGNLAYIGPRRTCRTCKRRREAFAACERRTLLGDTQHA
jgi:hypothetical protein